MTTSDRNSEQSQTPPPPPRPLHLHGDDKEEYWSYKSKIQLLVQRYCNVITEEPLSYVMRWAPLIMLHILARTVNATVAVWTAFGMNASQIVLEYFHSTYKPQYPSWTWLSSAQTLTFFGLGVADAALRRRGGLDPALLSPVVFSVLLATACLSVAVGMPFTKQLTQHRVSDEVRRSDGFHRLTVVLAVFWMGLFATAAGCAWAAYAVQNDESLPHAVHAVVGTALPLLVMAGGVLATPVIGKALKAKYGVKGIADVEPEKDDSGEEEAENANDNDQDTEAYASNLV
eukprot:CAMPEP_0197468744 /NCGR_PEP_ID=MMETSP1175-20131217/66241_1 /TAXON_ID=1003142 /ORGANISM="Triceratium dubium, Strain CCMP147" /LENGTH=286 /DNA_ID=CAMNT_0043004861 /DNA_START=942 /DNA_END=1802 /DNA_ORIENTATION=-